MLSTVSTSANRARIGDARSRKLCMQARVPASPRHLTQSNGNYYANHLSKCAFEFSALSRRSLLTRCSHAFRGFLDGREVLDKLEGRSRPGAFTNLLPSTVPRV